jgi:S1-C subfamily serine protease
VPGSVVDLILIALIIMFALNGYRQGFLVGALSFFGFFGGALIGLQLAPIIVERMDSPLARVIVSLACVFGLALGGQTLAAWAGTRLRHAISSVGGRKVDDIGGIGVSVIALLLVAWMVAGPLGSSSVPSVAASVRNSAILGAVDAVMPSQARILYNGLRDTIANGDFPNVFGDLTPTHAREVEPPDPTLARTPAVRTARESVVKILGSAPSCRRRIEGSGFVYAPQHVMTNAHVVAGTRGALEVQVNGERESGRVIHYDANRDLAVLYVPRLDAPPMRWADQKAETGDDAIVIGYPLDGPFTATAARVRDVRRVKGPNIYENQTVVREVYTIRAKVRSGGTQRQLRRPAGQPGWPPARRHLRRRRGRPGDRLRADRRRGPPGRRPVRDPNRRGEHRQLRLGVKIVATSGTCGLTAGWRPQRRGSCGDQGGGRCANWTSRVPSRRVTSQPRPGGCGPGRTAATRAPSSRSPDMTTPGMPSSRRRCRTGSYRARAAPPARRARTRCRPTSRAWARYSSRGSSGLVAAVATRS